MRGERVQHATEHLDCACAKLLEELIKAGLHNIAIDHVEVEELDNQAHVAMHLVLLLSLKLILIEHKQHLLIEVLLKVILDENLLHGCSTLPPIVLLTLKHLVELALAASE